VRCELGRAVFGRRRWRCRRRWRWRDRRFGRRWRQRGFRRRFGFSGRRRFGRRRSHRVAVAARRARVAPPPTLGPSRRLVPRRLAGAPWRFLLGMREECARPEPPGPRRPDLRQPHVPPERRRLRRSQQPRQRRDQRNRADPRRGQLRHPAPTNPHRNLSPGAAPILPPSAAQAAVLRRSSSMSASWSSTQSPGLREKMISFSPSDHRPLVAASRVRARWIASACCWMSNGLTVRQ
jgi:hypothetical protein